MRTLYLLPIFMFSILLCLDVNAGELPFETAKARYQTVSREQIFDGVIEAVSRTTVSAQTAGRVIEVLFDVDDFVEKNEVVARLRDKDQRAQLEQSEANMAEAQARFTEARTEYRRIEDIFEKNLISRSEYDRAKAKTETSKARLEAAKAALDIAQEQLDYTQIRAPYSGIVTKRHVELGETVRVGQPVMTGVSLEKLRVKVAVPQRLINPIRRLGQAKVFHQGDEVSPIPAEALTFFPYADVHTNTFEVRVEIPEGTKGLFPGMFVKVAFVTGERRQLVIPAVTLVYRSELTAVYIVNPDNSVRLRQVRPGRSAGGDMIEILAGLDEGESVALDPVKAVAYLKETRKQGELDE